MLGSLKIPAFNNPTHDKILIPKEWVFAVDVDSCVVSVTNGKEKYCVGDTITYIVES